MEYEVQPKSFVIPNCNQGRSQGFQSGELIGWWGRFHGERGSASLYGVWELGPQWGLGAKPLVGGQGDKVPLKLAIFSNWNYIIITEFVTICAKLETI